MTTSIEFEVCIDSVEGAFAAVRAAQRVELCANLFEGGTTPSLGMIQAVRQATSLDVMVLIRPRSGGFCFSDHEVDVMLRDIDAAAEAGAHGVAIGALSPDGQVERAIVRLLVDAARPMSITFHRAFDWTCNPYEALDCLVELGLDRVLTSAKNKRPNWAFRCCGICSNKRRGKSRSCPEEVFTRTTSPRSSRGQGLGKSTSVRASWLNAPKHFIAAKSVSPLLRPRTNGTCASLRNNASVTCGRPPWRQGRKQQVSIIKFRTTPRHQTQMTQTRDSTNCDSSDNPLRTGGRWVSGSWTGNFSRASAAIRASMP